MGEGALRASFGYHPFVALAVALGFVAFVTLPATAAQSTLPGIDISHWNGDVDLGQVKTDGIRFVIAKATEGTTFLDPKYATNKQKAEARAVAFTAYHYARPDTSAGDAVKEADWFVSKAQLTGKNMIPVLDLETSGGLSVQKLTAWAKAWLAEVQAQVGVKPIIYTNTPFWKTSLGNTTWFADNGYRLWIARWTSDSQPVLPAADWGGHGWTLWQYDSCGAVAGIDGCVDVDRYHGTSLAPLKIKNNR